MKKIIFMALFAATLSACSNENNEVTQETTNLKSLDFSFDVATPKTRMSDDEVTTAIIYAAGLQACLPHLLPA